MCLQRQYLLKYPSKYKSNHNQETEKECVIPFTSNYCP